MYNAIRDVELLNAYLGPPKRSDEDMSPEELTFESESQTLAGFHEVTHLASIANVDWQLFWRGELGRSLKEPLMSGIFFLHFTLQAGSIIATKTYVLICLSPLFTIYRRLQK